MAHIVIRWAPFRLVVGGVGLVSVGIGEIAVRHLVKRFGPGVVSGEIETIGDAAREAEIERVVGLMGVSLREIGGVNRCELRCTGAVDRCRGALRVNEVLVHQPCEVITDAAGITNGGDHVGRQLILKSKSVEDAHRLLDGGRSAVDLEALCVGNAIAGR